MSANLSQRIRRDEELVRSVLQRSLFAAGVLIVATLIFAGLYFVVASLE